MITALVVGAYEGALDMMQRRVGGILKGLAKIYTCRPDEIDNYNAQLLITYAYGELLPYLKERSEYGNQTAIGIELTPLAIGLKTIARLQGGLRLGIVAVHIRCANYFLYELVKTTSLENKCIIGTFSEIQQMNVDKFLVPEEMYYLINEPVKQEIIAVPRTISPMSAAELIDVALELSNY